MIAERVTTADGSPTYLHPGHGASYRSTNGAATESRWVFLNGSRITERPGRWRILEMSFGTGLNFQLTCEAAREAGVALDYVALEPEPMSADLWLVEEPWRRLEWGAPLSHESVTLTLHKSPWQSFEPPSRSFDALYHDPFGPSVTPECWSADCFAWGARALTDDGVLATYGAASSARRAMKEAGLLVGVLQGAPGKREMTVAARTAEAIAHARPWKR